MPSYSGIILDKESHQKLLDIFEGTWSGENGWEPVAHHLTLNIGELVPNMKRFLGQKFTMKVVAFSGNNLVKAVEVEAPIKTVNKTPHITLAVNRNRGGKPVMSNALNNWVPVKQEIYVTGTVQEV